MSKMGNYYIEQMEKQFGDVIVSSETPCSICGERYGDHMGLTCPPKECPLCGNPSEGYMITHKECADREVMLADLPF